MKRLLLINNLIAKLAIIILALGVSFAANAQNPTSPNTPGYTTNGSNWIADSPSTPHPVVLSGGTQVSAVGTGTTGAVTATLAANATKFNYLCGFDISAIGGTATIGPITITGLNGGNTFTYQLASTASGNTLSRTFSPCIQSNAINTAITITTTADGTASAVDVNAYGYVGF